MTTPMLRSMSLSLLMLCGAAAAQAQVTVKEPWVRGTVAGQKATGAFMTLTSATDARLVSVASPVAGLVEVHEMAMSNGTMQMRALPSGLALPAGKPVELKPGGYHVMLMDLKQPVKAGDSVPLKLLIEGADKARQTIDVTATVQALGAAPAKMPAPMPAHEHGDHAH
jgi:periplasmic copper chaperone A